MKRIKNKLIIALVLLLTLVIPTGCAYTTIEKHPDGGFRYTSTRDSSLEELHLTRMADGSVELDVNGASGKVSSVIDSQADLLRVLMQAMYEAGVKSVNPVD